MITDREYKELLERYGFEVDYGDGYIKHDEYIGGFDGFKNFGSRNIISKWYCDGDVFIYNSITIRNRKIVFGPMSIGCSSPKEFENKLQNLTKKIKNMKEKLKLAKIKELF